MPGTVSAQLAIAEPRRIKATHRRRRKIAAGHFVQRYYDPQIGRFLSVDPVTAFGGDMRHFNRYAYAYNNPYRFTDPDGRCPSCDRHNDQYAREAAAGNSGVYAPMVGPAAVVAMAALPLAPAARGVVGLVKNGNCYFQRW